jgi:hypothetical protein
MGKPKKILRTIVIAILLVILVILIAIDIFAGRLLKIGIETAATKTLNVGVDVGSVDLSITGGKLGIKGLSIDNPSGYQHEQLLKLKEVRVAVEIKSLLGNTVNIKEIYLDGMDMVLEQRGVTSNNIQDIIGSIEKKEKEVEEAKEPAEPSGKKLHVDSLEISNVVVKAKLLPVPGKADTVTLKLDPIKMTDLGGDNKMDMAKLSRKILLVIAKGISKQGDGLLPDDMVNTMKSSVDSAMALGKTTIEESKKALEQNTDVGKEITEGLKGLFKPKEQ